jgi:hypothetical protein
VKERDFREHGRGAKNKQERGVVDDGERSLARFTARNEHGNCSGRRETKDRIPGYKFDLVAFNAEERVLLECMLEDLDFFEASNRREQIVAPSKILRAADIPIRFAFSLSAVFSGSSSSTSTKPAALIAPTGAK